MCLCEWLGRKQSLFMCSSSAYQPLHIHQFIAVHQWEQERVKWQHKTKNPKPILAGLFLNKAHLDSQSSTQYLKQQEAKSKY